MPTEVRGESWQHPSIQPASLGLWIKATYSTQRHRGRGRFIAIECKLGEAPGEESTRAFNAFSEDYGKGAIGQALVVCRTPRKYGLKSFPRTSAVGVERAVEALRGS